MGSEVTLYKGDCLVEMNKIPDGSVDCVICDLPYGTIAAKWDSVIPSELLWEQYKRILKHQGSVLLFGSEPFSTYLRMSNIDWFKYDWIWLKNTHTGFQHAKNMPLKDYEIISVFSAAGMGHQNLLGENRMIYNPQGIICVNKEWKRKNPNNFGNIAGKRESHKTEHIQEFENYPKMTLSFDKDVKSFHPTQKPVDLLRYLVLTYTNKGDVVLDNCMGSGSTGVACVRENRNFIGIELDDKYFEIAKKRIETEQQQLKLF